MISTNLVLQSTRLFVISWRNRRELNSYIRTKAHTHTIHIVRVTRFIFPSLNIFRSSSISPTPSFVDLTKPLMLSSLSVSRIRIRRQKEGKKRSAIRDVISESFLSRWCSESDYSGVARRRRRRMCTRINFAATTRSPFRNFLCLCGEEKLRLALLNGVKPRPDLTRGENHLRGGYGNAAQLAQPTHFFDSLPLDWLVVHYVFFSFQSKKFIFSLNNRNV